MRYCMNQEAIYGAGECGISKDELERSKDELDNLRMLKSSASCVDGGGGGQLEGSVADITKLMKNVKMAYSEDNRETFARKQKGRYPGSRSSVGNVQENGNKEEESLGNELGSELGDELLLGCKLGNELGCELGDELLLGCKLGNELGCELGDELILGCKLGNELGCELGDELLLGCKLGNELGCELGDELLLGCKLGNELGCELGDELGVSEGVLEGVLEGDIIGDNVGDNVGDDVGISVLTQSGSNVCSDRPWLPPLQPSLFQPSLFQLSLPQVSPCQLLWQQ
eukprot:scaffold5293_cov97-Skeletonema_marinoi.AAC.1